MGERGETQPGLHERIGLIGYSGLGIMLAGQVFGGPSGLALSGVGAVTTLAGALIYFVLLLIRRPWQARED